MCHVLSEPVSHSVNENIDKSDWPEFFDRLGVAATSVMRTGPSTYTAKVTWKVAYEEMFVCL